MRWLERVYGYLFLGAMYAVVAGLAVCAVLVLIVVPILLALGVELPHWETVPGGDGARWSWGDL